MVLFGNVQTRPLFGRVFQKEAARVDIAALYLLDEPFRDLLSDIDRRGARAVSILLGAIPIIVLYRLPAGGRDVRGVDDEALVDRQQVFPLQDPTAD